MFPSSIAVYLNIPFALKDVAKRRGMRWCPTNKKWYNKISLEEFNWEDLEESICEIVEYFNNELLQFEFHSISFWGTYYDEAGFIEMFKVNYNKMKSNKLL
jgi:hypothetical protein